MDLRLLRNVTYTELSMAFEHTYFVIALAVEGLLKSNHRRVLLNLPREGRVSLKTRKLCTDKAKQ